MEMRRGARTCDSPYMLRRVLDSALMQARVRLSCSDGLMYLGSHTFQRHASPPLLEQLPTLLTETVPQAGFFFKNLPAKFFLRGPWGTPLLWGTQRTWKICQNFQKRQDISTNFFGHPSITSSNKPYELHRYEIPIEILSKMKLFRPKSATP